MNQEKKQYLTREKFDQLEKELVQLRSVGRREIAESLEYAKSLGDLSENAEYHQAREKQAQMEARLAHIEAILKNAVIVEPKKGSVVDIGSTVTYLKKGEKTSQTVTIVGSEEADIVAGKLSDISPMGESLLGKKEGDSGAVATPGGNVQYEIIKVQ
jgi:transcription elongation factor GreA